MTKQYWMSLRLNANYEVTNYSKIFPYGKYENVLSYSYWIFYFFNSFIHQGVLLRNCDAWVSYE